MVAKDIGISACLHMQLCKEEDKDKLIFLCKKRVPGRCHGKYVKHYEYIYILWTNKEKGEGQLYRSTILLGE